MRKISVFIFLISLLVTLVACSKSAVLNPDSKPTEILYFENTDPEETHASEDTEPPETQNAETTAGPEMQIELNFVSCYSLEAYERYFSSLGYVPDMVLYEDISRLGKFKSYVDTATLRTNKPSCIGYTYELIDASGYEIYVHIRHITYPESLAPEKIYEKQEMTAKGDLRQYNGTQKALLLQDGIHYTYTKGKIDFMYWYENGMMIRIGGDSPLYEYPDTTDTLVGKLLNSATAPDAIKTIKAMNITEGLPRGTADANITPVS